MNTVRRAAHGQQSESADDPRASNGDDQVVTVRGLVILIVSMAIGGLAGVGAGTTAAAKVQTDLAIVIGVTVGLAVGAMTAITAASRLHKLVKRE